MNSGAASSLERFSAATGFPVDLFGDDFDWDEFVERAPERLAFIDIETCGLGDTLVFLAGTMSYGADAGKGRVFELGLHMANDPSAEARVLRAAAAVLDAAPTWVSFNGKSFDLPRLRKRAFRHGIAFPEGALHVDLLQEVRRRWRGALPDCRLTTVERRLLGLERGPDDIPGREVPDRYWDFVTLGKPALIEPVREHNRRDVLAMAALLLRLLRDGLELPG